MIRPIFRLLPAAAVAALASCATSPLVIDSRHPASMDAPEASAKTMRGSLRGDDATRRTGELLAQRAKQAEAAESEAAVTQSDPNLKAPNAPGIPASAPSSKMKMEGHEHH